MHFNLMPNDSSSLFLFLLRPSFRCTLFLTILFFNAPHSLEKRISLSEIHPWLQTSLLFLWPATLYIWSSSSPFTLEHSLSFVITLPLAVRLAPLLSSCHLAAPSFSC